MAEENLTSETVPSVLPKGTEKPFDPGPQREQVRGRLATGLTGLMGLVLCVLLYGAVTGKVADKDFALALLASISGLVGSVVGFYFGSQK